MVSNLALHSLIILDKVHLAAEQIRQDKALPLVRRLQRTGAQEK
jgi:hypothetical protein